MSHLTADKIENAFLPAREITDPSRFAGRVDQVEQAYLALLSSGTNIAIIGNRGIGKSSLARQVIAMAEGKSDLLKRHQIPTSSQLDFLTIYLACGGETRNTHDLITRLLTSHDCLAEWIYNTPAATRAITSYSPKFGGSVFGVGIELSGEKSSETTLQSAAPTADSTTVLTNVLSIISKEGVAKDGILIIIDEFDQIKDTSGFASLLKSLATNAPLVRFCIVGVAHNLHSLIQEHQSADRLFAGGVINLPSMTSEELTEVVSIAEEAIGGQITFSESGRKRLISLAQGHPYMTHLVGKHSLRAAWKIGSSVISSDDVDDTLRSIARSGADPVLEARYKKAIASSPQREAVLRAMAESEKNGEIWTTEAYPVAIRAGVDNPSQYVGSLVTEDYGAEVIKVRERYYRFKDSLFRAYVMARPAAYADRL